MKYKIFVNAKNNHFAGGKTILLNLIKCANLNSNHNLDYIFYLPKDLSIEDNKNISIIQDDNFNNLYYYFFYCNKLLKKYKIDLVVNISDIPIRTNINQIFLFDWSYAIYNEDYIWGRLSLKDLIFKKLKKSIFKILRKNISLYLAQTNTAKKRLVQFYKIPDKRIEIFPNSISLDHFKSKKNKIELSIKENKKKFLSLTGYYPHKNLEILIDVAKLIKKSNKNYQILLTLELSKKNRKFIKKIEDLKLNEVIVNLGSIDQKNIPFLYSQVDALLLPTLLESFSGTYIESIYTKTPIFTSKLDFAIDVCEDAAIYFDPFDAKSIFNSMSLIDDKELIRVKISKYNKLLKKNISWKTLFTKLQKMILKELIS